MLNRLLILMAIVVSFGLYSCSSSTADNASKTGKEVVDKAANAAKTAGDKVANATNKAANAAADAIDPDQPTTTVSWDKEEHDFGDINEGDKVATQFKFTNTGNEPLIISSAKGSCGCTVPKWPKEPVPPGGTGSIDVEFNSKNKPGRQTKTVTIQANTDPNPIRLKIKAQVAKNEDAAAGN